MDTFVFVIIWLFFGAICYSIAERKNRNKILWGVLGFIFGLLSVIIILVLPPVDINATKDENKL